MPLTSIRPADKYLNCLDPNCRQYATCRVNLPNLKTGAYPDPSTPPPPWLATLVSPEKPSRERTTVRAPRRPAPGIRLGNVRQPAVGTERQGDYSIAGGQNELQVRYPQILSGRQLPHRMRYALYV